MKNKRFLTHCLSYKVREEQKKKKNGTENCNKTRTFHKIAIKAWYVVTEGNGTKRKNQIPGQKLEFYEFQRE